MFLMRSVRNGNVETDQIRVKVRWTLDFEFHRFLNYNAVELSQAFKAYCLRINSENVMKATLDLECHDFYKDFCAKISLHIFFEILGK